MAYRKSRLKLKHQDLAINADIRTAKLDPEALEDPPEIIRRETQTGSLVIRQLYNKSTEKPLSEGYGYRWVTEDGEEIPAEDVGLYVIEDGKEEPFSEQDPTLGADRTVSPETWIPVPTIDQYLTENIYEMWGAETIDVAQLYELAEHIRQTDEAPVIPFLLQKAMFRNWGIITPFFFDDSFSLVIRVTNRKIDPEHEMPILTPEDVAEAEADAEAVPHLKQESPFE